MDKIKKMEVMTLEITIMDFNRSQFNKIIKTAKTVANGPFNQVRYLTKVHFTNQRGTHREIQAEAIKTKGIQISTQPNNQETKNITVM